jgi:hypothetical protein
MPKRKKRRRNSCHRRAQDFQDHLKRLKNCCEATKAKHMQPRSACEKASTEIQRYGENSEKREDEYLFVFVVFVDRWSFGAWTGGPFALPCYGAWMNDGYRGVPSNAMGH